MFCGLLMSCPKDREYEEMENIKITRLTFLHKRRRLYLFCSHVTKTIDYSKRIREISHSFQLLSLFWSQWSDCVCVWSQIKRLTSLIHLFLFPQNRFPYSV